MSLLTTTPFCPAEVTAFAEHIPPCVTVRAQPADRWTAVWCLFPDRAARRAREVLRDRLSGLPLPPDTAAELEVVIGELVANAVCHSRGPYELRITHHRERPVRVEVVDAGTEAELIARLLRDRPAVPDRVEELRVGGQGLLIVAALTGGRCGARRVRLLGTGQPGTGVWFDLPGAAGPPADPV